MCHVSLKMCWLRSQSVSRVHSARLPPAQAQSWRRDKDREERGIFSCAAHTNQTAQPLQTFPQVPRAWAPCFNLQESWGWKNPPRPSSAVPPALPRLLLISATSTWLFNPSRDGDSSTALSSLCQGLTSLSMKKYFPISNLNLPWCNVWPHLLDPSLFTWEKRDWILPGYNLHSGSFDLLSEKVSLNLLFSRLNLPTDSWAKLEWPCWGTKSQTPLGLCIVNTSFIFQTPCSFNNMWTQHKHSENVRSCMILK